MLSFAKRLRSDLPNIFLTLIWAVINLSLFVADYRKYFYHEEFFYLRVLIGGHFLALARASALCLKLNSALVLIPVCRNCLSFLRSLLVNCPEPAGRSTRRLLDSHVIHHKWIGRSILFFTFLHVLAHAFNVERLCQAFDSDNDVHLALSRYPDNLPNLRASNYLNPIRFTTSPYSVLFTTTPGFTGIVATGVLILIWTSASRVVRIYAFELFWITHHLFVVFFAALGVHGMGGFIRRQINVEAHDPRLCVDLIKEWGKRPDCPFPAFEPSPPTAWKWIVGPLAFYVLERLVKLIRTRHPYRITEIIFHPSNVLELRMIPSVGSRVPVEPGQYVSLQCPALSRFEWHPFTLTSAPDDDHISVHIRGVGDWTKGLAELCQQQQRQHPSQQQRQERPVPVELNSAPIIYVDGPFGAASEEWFSYETAVFVGAGIGVTPFASVLKHVANRRRAGRLESSVSYVRKIHFFWVTPEIKAFEWFRDLLHELETSTSSGGRGATAVGPASSPDKLLAYHIFLTRGWDPKDAGAIAARDRAATYDAFSNLHHRTEFGRPNWHVELNKVVGGMEAGSRVGVFLCGPKPLAQELKEACNNVNETAVNGTKLYFNKEHF